MKFDTYGFADEHSTLIGYRQCSSEADARSFAREWLELHPAATCVEMWIDDGASKSQTVSR